MSVVLIGNVVSDPAIRFLDSGKPVATFSIAVKRGKQGEEHTSFFDCAAWGTIAENIANSFHRGDRVIISGELKQRTYEDKNNNKRSAVEVQVDGAGHDLRWATTAVSKVEQ